MDGVSLSVWAGEMIGIVGPSGTGKTTLGRCISGLEVPDTGAIILDGIPVQPRGLKPHDGRIQMIYQSPASSLNPGMRARSVIGEALSRISPQQPTMALDAERVRSLLGTVGLGEDVMTKYPSELSGGEKQRVAVARSLAREPLLIIADEPTASLNETNKHAVLELLQKFAGGIAPVGGRRSVILITHERELALKYCSRMFEMSKGRLLEMAQADQHQPG